MESGYRSAVSFSKGAWLEIILRMWDTKERGVLSGTFEEFSRLIGCTPPQAETVIANLERHNICDVSRVCNGVVILSCRRMVRDEVARQKNRERVARYRERNENVTPSFVQWIEELKPLYPKLDVEEQFRMARSWLLTKPGRKATKKFFVNWLLRASQNILEFSTNGNGSHPRASDYNEVKALVVGTLNLQEDDAAWAWEREQGNNWTDYGRPFYDWKDAFSAWEREGKFPSQKKSR